MWAATGSIKIGAAFGIAELIIKPSLYYLHERFWYRYMKYGLVGVKPIKKVKDLKEEPQILEQPEKPKIKRLTYTKKAN